MSRYDRLLAHEFATLRHQFSRRDTILYALGVGAGVDELDLIYEPRLVAIPSMAAVLAYPGNWYADPAVELDGRLTVHGSERIEIHTVLPVAGDVSATPRIIAIHDKGPGRGAVVVSQRELRDTVSGALVATVTQRAFCRADGGMGGPEHAVPPALPMPQRSADRTLMMPTSPRAAAIYRLMGDDNPLHIDPSYAESAGFSKPVLHGLASFGHICRAMLRGVAASRLRMMDCRFVAPVYPGETLEIDLWETASEINFRARVGLRVVIDSGRVLLAPDLPQPPGATKD